MKPTFSAIINPSKAKVFIPLKMLPTKWLLQELPLLTAHPIYLVFLNSLIPKPTPLTESLPSNIFISTSQKFAEEKKYTKFSKSKILKMTTCAENYKKKLVSFRSIVDKKKFCPDYRPSFIKRNIC